MEQRKSDYYRKVMDRSYQPNKDDLNKDMSVPATPEQLAQAVTKGGADRKEPEQES